MKTVFEDVSNGGQPETLLPLIGRTVTRAFILPSGKCLLFTIEGGVCVMVKREKAVGMGCIAFEIGEEKRGANWDGIEHLAQDPHLKALIGMKFTGLDQDVVTFGNYGVKMTLQGIVWVRAAR